MWGPGFLPVGVSLMLLWWVCRVSRKWVLPSSTHSLYVWQIWAEHSNSVFWIFLLTELREILEVWKTLLNFEDVQNNTMTSWSDLHLFEVDGSLQHRKVNMTDASQCFSKTENGARTVHACTVLKKSDLLHYAKRTSTSTLLSFSRKETSIICRGKPEHLRITCSTNVDKRTIMMLCTYWFFSTFPSSWTSQTCHTVTQILCIPKFTVVIGLGIFLSPRLAMVLLLLIWNFCLAIIVTYSCENSPSYFHRWQGWLVFDYLTSWCWPDRKPHANVYRFYTEFYKTFGIGILAWKPGPFGQCRFDVKFLGLSLGTMGQFYQRQELLSCSAS